MSAALLRVFPSPAAIGEEVAQRLLQRIELAQISGKRFLLGCPTGRTPRPVYDALVRELSRKRQDMSHVVLVMMDEYLAPGEGGLLYAPANNVWSCHYFARVEFAGRLNDGLPPSCQLPAKSIWFPEPGDPEAFDRRIHDEGGIDFFILASGASDGHVGFNPPGSARESITRIIQLAEDTRRDNLLTFPAFETLSSVPSHGISVGIATIASAREAVMIVWGAGKRRSLARMMSAERYDPEWPATVIHECQGGQILADADAAEGFLSDRGPLEM
jgi:glucosamine-6-phosphate deaminase